MKILLSWLKEHVDFSADAETLAAALTEVGLAVDGIERRGTDAILDIDVTTNRVDCMNVRGVAREVAVIYGVPLTPLETQLDEAGQPAGAALRVTIEAPELCPRFCARVLDVRLGPSPAWLRERLEAVGVRPISNVVDLTNYVMMELGQPSHAFDLARVPGAELRVRWAREGEKLKTLDGVERTLGSRVGVVAGPSDALALAGVMGGASSEVGDETRVVALEAAYWDPLSTRRSARSLGMHTEASHRFERGSDPEAPVAATARLAHLLGRIGAGSARPGLIDVHPAPRPRAQAPLRSSRLRLVLGVDVPEARTQAILSGLGFTVGSQGVEVPSWRGDVTREIDLVEEVGRHFGVNRVPSSVPASRRPGELRPAQLAERRLRDVLVGAGLFEVVGYSFVARLLNGTEGVRLANPLAADQGLLRTSLVEPGLFDALRANLSQGRREVRLFELGRVFLPRPGMPHEPPRLAFLLAGNARAPHWSERPRPSDLFDARGLVELVAAAMGWEGIGFEPGGQLPSFLHPGRSASIRHGGASIGWLGSVHPEFAQASELRDETVVAELSLDGLIASTPRAERFQPLPRYPAVARDVSVLCERGMRAQDIEAWVRAAAGPLLREVVVSDRYEGPPLPQDRLSLTLTLRYQDPERTLVGEEVQKSISDVVRALRTHGAEIRGE